MPHAIREGDIPGVQLRCDVTLAASREDVWRWLTESERMQLWLGDEIVILEEGEFELRGCTGDGGELLERLRTVSQESGQSWVMAFERLDAGWERATRLSFELSGERPCQLSVVQQGFERLSLSRCLTVWEFYRRRWRGALERLVEEMTQSSDLD